MKLIALALAACSIATSAMAEGWNMQGSADSPPILMTLQMETVGYKFECDHDRVRITETGVTQLMNLQSGGRVSDAPGTVLAPEDAVMALSTDRRATEMIAGSAVSNPTHGWDLTIELSKTDPVFLGLSRAHSISLMTTGWTVAVELSASDRRLFADYVAACRALH